MSPSRRTPALVLAPSTEGAAFVIGAIREHARRFKINGAVVPPEVWELEALLTSGVTQGHAVPTSAASPRSEQVEVMTPRLVTYETAADLLSISVRSLKRRIQDGQLHPIAIGGASRIRVAEIDAIAAGVSTLTEEGQRA